jgi:hypothetical protein
VCILPGWLLSDSIGLRYIIMFIGLFSAVYAVQDIYDDGVKHRHISGSDANAYASFMIGEPSIDYEDGNWQEQLDEYEARLQSRTKREL